MDGFDFSKSSGDDTPLYPKKMKGDMKKNDSVGAGDSKDIYSSMAFEEYGVTTAAAFKSKNGGAGHGYCKWIQDHSYISSAFLIFMASFVYMYRIGYIDSVVFDEVHFGGMSNRYLTRRFYYDLHPPLGKFIFALVGYIRGYSGNFRFQKIHMSFVDSFHSSELTSQYYPELVDGSQAPPYLSYRFTAAVFGAALPLLGFLTTRELGASNFGAILAASALLLETTFITQSRYIFLDSPMTFFSSLSIYLYYRFRNYNHAFTKGWTSRMLVTGIALGLSISVKWIALFTMFALGIQTLYDLFMMVKNKDLELAIIKRHFWYRCFFLFCVPIMIYITLYSMHISLMKYGLLSDKRYLYPTYTDYLWTWSQPEPNYDYIYPTTQFELRDNSTSILIPALMHGNGKPREQFRFLPAIHPNSDLKSINTPNENNEFFYTPIKTGSYVYLVSTSNDSCLSLSEDNKGSPQKKDCDIFIIDLTTAKYVKPTPNTAETTNSDEKKTKSAEAKHDGVHLIEKSEFRLKLANRDQLSGDSGNDADCYLNYAINRQFACLPLTEEQLSKRNTSIFTLQGVFQVYNIPNTGKSIPPKSKMGLMKILYTVIIHNYRAYISNSRISTKHAYQSFPLDWVLLRKGTSYWQNKLDSQQVFLLGNPFVYWGCLAGFIAFLFFSVFIFVREKRKIYDLDPEMRHKYLMIFMMYFCFMANVLPFLGLARQLFLHHYLNAHYANIIAFACFIDLIFINFASRTKTILLAVIISMYFYGYWVFSPLAYGIPVPGGTGRMKWLKTWNFV